MKRKLTSLLLCAVFCLCTSLPAFAAEGTDAEPETGTLKIVNYNVDGLPVPAFLSKSKRDPLACSKQMPAQLNAFDADIIAVQEDFNFHTTLKTRIDAKYTTYHNGGIPFGDGLNFFSKLPLYNVTRVPWETAYGIFDAGSDELTPKGFLCSSVQLADGVYVDVYDLHADAYGGSPNAAARAAQYRQLLAFIDDYSKDHAVIVTGDTNTRFLDTESELRKQFIDEAQFKEVWIELENEGRYALTSEDVARFNEKYPSSYGEWYSYWGKWDSVEKVFYRSGGGVSLEAAAHEYVILTDDQGVSLSDHAAEVATLTYTVDRSVLNDTRSYEKEHLHPFTTFFNHMRAFFKALKLILGELPKVFSGEIKIKIDK